MLDRRTFLQAAGLAAVAGPAALSACASDPQDVSQANRLVQYGTPAGPANVLLSWYGIADRLGYFAEEGINSQVRTAISPFPLVDNGRLQMIVAGASELLPFVAGNPSSDLMVAWTSTPQPFYRTVVPADSDVSEFHQLAGKKIACLGPGALWWLIDAICTESGMSPTDVTKVTVPAGAALATAFRKGQVDAGIYADAQVVQADELLAGTALGPLRVLPLPAGLQKTGGTTNIVKRSSLDRDRDLYVRYMRAVAKGFTFLDANPAAGMAVHLDGFPSLRQPGESRREAIDRMVTEVQPRLQVSRAPEWAAQKHPWGWTYEENLTGWQRIIPALKGTQLDVSRLYTNDLVAPAHEFDVAAVQAAARAHPVD